MRTTDTTRMLPSTIADLAGLQSPSLNLYRILSFRITTTTTMPPHLHPRSRMTSSLFATTMLGSFFVVALPHILPCPSPRVTYADGEIIEDENGRRRRRRRPQEQVQTSEAKGGVVQLDNITQEDLIEQQGRRGRHECPVPKPGGKLGELLGFKQPGTQQSHDGTQGRSV